MDNSTVNIKNLGIWLETNEIGRNIILLEEVDSTNSYLMNRNEDFPHGTVVVAEKQLAGRGRFNREWVSGKGLNLTFSILLSKVELMSLANIINLGTSLIISRTLENIYMIKPHLKWPNDVLVNNKKISGVLLESKSSGSSLKEIVVGIGLNVNQPVFHGEFLIPPTSVYSELKMVVERDKLLSELLNNFEEMLERIKTKPNGVLNDWRDRCRMIGENVAIQQMDKVKYGVFSDIDQNGNLVLQTESKTEFINFGDVSLVK